MILNALYRMELDKKKELKGILNALYRMELDQKKMQD